MLVSERTIIFTILLLLLTFFFKFQRYSLYTQIVKTKFIIESHAIFNKKIIRIVVQKKTTKCHNRRQATISMVVTRTAQYHDVFEKSAG